MTRRITQGPSILKHLRSLSPTRACTFTEALGLAERQAARFNQILSTDSLSYQLGGITDHHIADLPRFTVVYERLPVSGMSHWNGQEWIICINKDDPEVRQRFTLLHEFKHVIDHGRTGQLYTGGSRTTAHDQAERAADYFAGCTLVPRVALKSAWGNGLQRPAVLAEHFGVSEAAIRVRLDQTGLSREIDPEPEDNQPRARCQRPVWTPRWQKQRFEIREPNYAERNRRYAHHH